MYFYDLDYFPVPSVYNKTYRVENVEQQKPSIVKTIEDGIYEVDDQYKFYTNLSGQYHVLVYKFEYLEANVTLTKYRQLNTAEYFVCVKSDKIIPDVHVIKPKFNVDILHPETFDAVEYFKLDGARFLVKKDGLTVDILSRDKNVYACIKQYAEHIGTMSDSKQIFMKGELMQDKIYIFDAFIFGEILDMPYVERMNAIKISELNLTNKYHLEISKMHSTFKEAYGESESLPNDGIIIQPMYAEPYKWKPNKLNTVDFLVSNDLFVRKGANFLINFKSITNDKFNRRLITEYVNKYNGEIIELGIDGQFHRNRLDKNKPNAVGTYISSLNPKNTIPVSVMLGNDKLTVSYIITAKLEIIMHYYMHGSIIETQIDCIALKQIDNIIFTDKVLMLEDVSLDSSCVISNKITRDIIEYLEDEEINEKYDTFLLMNNALNISKLLNAAARKSSECAHIILTISANSDIPEHKDFRLSEKILLDNNQVSDEYRDLLNTYVVVYSKITKEKPIFVFVVGLMGSGKSGFIHNIRNYIHPPTKLNVMSIDDEVNNFISFHLYNTAQMYSDIRKKIDSQIDSRINAWIAAGESVVLETTKLDSDYVSHIKQTHKVIAIICNVTLEKLKDNIEKRNARNIRKTEVSKETYDKFQESKKTYINLVDELYEFRMEDKTFERLTS